jgi:type IV pilus assembly protein PilW
MRHALIRPARGVSLIELLVGMVIALMVLGIALQMMLIARARYQRLADEALIEDRAMQALELIGHAVRQAGWITDTPAASPVRRWPDTDKDAPPSLEGSDNCGRLDTPPQLVPQFNCGGGNVRRSDALLVRFAGRGSNGDGATLDCRGLGVPERADSKDPRGGYIVLFSGANTTDRELELRCRSLSRTDPNSADDSQSLVRGVETLQLLYTLAPSSTSAAETVPAREIGKQDWRRVQQVHVAIVVRGDRYRTLPPISDKVMLFSRTELGPLPKARTEDLEYQPQDPRRNHAVFTATFAVRNPLICEADAC